MSDPESGGPCKKNKESPGYSSNLELGPENALRTIRTAGSLSISPELFEQLYLNPKTSVKPTNLRSVVGNPSPIGLLGFIICLSPYTCQMMGWRGTSGTGASQVGLWYSMGGILMLLGCVFEFLIANTFSSVVFGLYGTWWIAEAITLTPAYNAAAAYDPSNPANPGFHASFGFSILFMGVATFIFFLCGLRTNIAYEIIFFSLTVGFCLASAAYWELAELNIQRAQSLQIASGAFFFITSITGWYIFLFLMLSSVESPINVPLGDLSHIIPARKKHVQEE